MRSRARKFSLPLLGRRVNYSSGHDWPVHISGAMTRLGGTGLKPQERFEAIITHSKTDHVPLLDGMYKFTLETIFRKEQPLSQRNRGLKRFKSVMAQILGTKEPLPLGPLTVMRCHFRVKDLADIDIRTIVDPMAALLSGATEPSLKRTAIVPFSQTCAMVYACL